MAHDTQYEPADQSHSANGPQEAADSSSWTPRDRGLSAKVASLLDDATITSLETRRPGDHPGQGRDGADPVVELPRSFSDPQDSSDRMEQGEAGLHSGEAGAESVEKGTVPLNSQEAGDTSAKLGTGVVEGNGIRIRGRSDGVSIELGTGDWNGIVAHLDTRLEQSADFFRGGQVSMDVAARPLVEVELKQVCDVLRKYGLEVGLLRSSSDRTFQAALNLGLSARLDTDVPGDSVTAETVPSNHEILTHFVYRGNLRSGQVLERPESILVIGDVNPGGQLVSAGDVLVWGRLRGVAHAGAAGDITGVVAALQFEPTQVRIAGLIAVSPESRSRSGGRWGRNEKNVQSAEIAYVANNRIVVARWNEAKRSGISVLLR